MSFKCEGESGVKEREREGERVCVCMCVFNASDIGPCKTSPEEKQN